MTMHILAIPLCGILMAWGGYNFLLARRLGLPMVICACTLFQVHNPWLLTQLAAYGVLCLGYGDSSPLRHIFGQSWGRGIWGLLAALAFSLSVLLTGHLTIPLFASYLVVCFFAEPLCKNLYQVAGDFIIGCAFGSIILLLH